ncbi:hypothetical protein JW968_02415 [Candidatus Woesearchaeota archaeon]|nr:hypothetical protein [Candidatus Woesearchaeota archaeon]
MKKYLVFALVFLLSTFAVYALNSAQKSDSALIPGTEHVTVPARFDLYLNQAAILHNNWISFAYVDEIAQVKVIRLNQGESKSVKPVLIEVKYTDGPTFSPADPIHTEYFYMDIGDSVYFNGVVLDLTGISNTWNVEFYVHYPEW